MAELIALVIGIADPLANRIEALFERTKSYLRHPENLQGAKDELSDLAEELGHVQVLLQGHSGLLQLHVRTYLNMTSNRAERKLNGLHEQVTGLEALVFGHTAPSSSSSRSSALIRRQIHRFSRFLRTSDITERIETLHRSAIETKHSCTGIAAQLNILFGRIESSAPVEDAVSTPSAAIESESASEPRTRLRTPAFNPEQQTTVLIPGEARFRASFAVPALRLNIVPVPEQERLKHVVLTSTPSMNSGLVATIAGAGGVGKTVALLALGSDSDVRARFPDGVYFIRIGLDATDRTVIQGLSNVMKESCGMAEAARIKSLASPLEAASQVAVHFTGRTALFLCDDVWSSFGRRSGYAVILKQILLFARESGSFMVFSTRDLFIADTIGGTSVLFSVAERVGQDALNLLLAAANSYIGDRGIPPLVYEDHTESIRSLLDFCNGHALTILLVGSMLGEVRDPAISWDESLMRMSASLSSRHLANSTGVPMFYTAIRLALRLARNVEHLERYGLDVSDLFERLGTLREQTAISTDLLSLLWYELPDECVRTLRDRLVRLSLLSTDIGGHDPVLRVHDLIMDYCRYTFAAKGTARSVHEKLLDSWLPRISREQSHRWVVPGFSLQLVEQTTRQWWQLSTTNGRRYVISNVARHLEEAGRAFELVGLVSHGAWTTLRVREGGIPELLTDFHHCTSALSTSMPEESSLIESIGHLRDAISDIGDTIVHDVPQIATQAHMRLSHRADAHGLLARFIQTSITAGSVPWARALRPPRPDPQGATYIEVPTHAVARNVAVDWSRMTAHVAGPAMYTEIDLGTRTTVFSQQLPFPCVDVHFPSQTVLLCDMGRALIAYDVKNGVALWQTELLHSVSVAVWSVDGGSVVCGGETTSGHGHVSIIRREGRVKLSNQAVHKQNVRAVAINEDGRRAVSATGQGVVVWNAESGNVQWVNFEAHVDSVNAVCIDHSGATVASGGDDRRIFIWRECGTESMFQLLHEISTPSFVCRLTFSGDGARLLRTEGSGRAIMQNVSAKHTVFSGPAGHAHIALQASEDGTRVAALSSDGVVRCWDTSEWLDDPHAEHEKHSNKVGAVAFDRSGESLLSVGVGDIARLWSTSTGRHIGTLQLDEVVVSSISIDAAAERMVVVCQKQVALFEVLSGTALFNITDALVRDCRVVAINRDGTRVVCCDDEGTMTLLDECGNRMSDWTIPDVKCPSSIACRGDGHRGIVTAGRKVILVNLHRDHEASVMTWSCDISSVSMSDDGSIAAIADENGNMHVTWLKSDEQVGYTLPNEHNGRVQAISLNSAGDVLVSAGGVDLLVKLFRVNKQSGVEDGFAELKVERILNVRLPVKPSCVSVGHKGGPNGKTMFAVGTQDGDVLMFQAEE